MPLFNFSAQDFLSRFIALLPRGPIWPRDLDANQNQVLAALTPVYARLAARDNNLVVDSFPATAQELLPEWEETLGFPDPCSGLASTVAARQQQVVAKLVNTGGQSVEFFIDLAKTLGLTVTIDFYKPFRVGDPVGSALWSGSAYFYWQVNVQGSRDENAVAFECTVNRYKPAQTLVRFRYSS